MYDKKTLSMVLGCWVHGNIGIKYPSHIPVGDAAMFMLSSMDYLGNLPPLDRLTTAYEIIDIPAFISRLQQLLKDKTIVDHNLMSEITVIFRFVHYHGPQPFVPLFLEHRIDHLAVDSVYNQVIKGKMPDVTQLTLSNVFFFLK